MSKIEELENKLIELQKEFEEIKNKNEKENKRWMLKIVDDYYYYDKDAESVFEKRWDNDRIDNIRLLNKVIFKTKKEAEEYEKYIKAKKDYSYEFSKEEWKDDIIKKYIISYDYDCEELDIDYSYCFRNINQIYFRTEEKAKEFIDKYEKQILKYEFGIEE